MSVPISPASDLRASLHALAELVDGVAFQMPGEGQASRNALRDDTTWSIDEYLLPRLGDLEAPLVAVLIGSTGSGKSTILNSLAQRQISSAGAIRPTTTMPVVWAHERNSSRYREGFLSGYGPGEQPMNVVDSSDPFVGSLTVIDAPDFDSVVDRHREMADDLLAIADVVVFVTSAQRYADAVPWEFLNKARSRSVPVLFVANRIPSEAEQLISDFRRLLLAEGFALENRFFEIEEQDIDTSHRGLPSEEVAGLRALLESMASESSRAAVLEGAIRGAIEGLSGSISRLEEAMAAESQEAQALRRVAADAYARQVDEVAQSLSSGELIRAEVVDRWQQFIGTGEMVKAIGEGVSRLSAWTRRVFGGKPSTAAVRGDARFELSDVLIRRADLAATAAASAWELDAAGAALLGGRALWRHSEETAELAEHAVEDWLLGISELIAEAGASKKRTALVASYGVNSVAVVVILGVFLQTGGLTGTEVGVAAGAAAAQQKVLEHIFGSAAARSLIETARKRIEETAGRVLEEDGARFGRLIDDHTGSLLDPGVVSGAYERTRSLMEAWHGV